MRVAIVHFHLELGGVTRTIANAVSAIAKEQVETVILTSEGPSAPWSTNIEKVPGLAYEDKLKSEDRRKNLAAELKHAARKALGADPDVWHFHNHSLGKNLAVLQAVHLLADEGHHLLLQIHDFAEDGRPSLYNRMFKTIGSANVKTLSMYAYPNASNVHYAVLNRRDWSVLDCAGVTTDRLHSLPNPAVVLDSTATISSDAQTGRKWLYPTRAIRRKNLGEFLFWAAVSEEEDHFETTLGPQNQAENKQYDEWRSFAHKLSLRVSFEVGSQDDKSFEDLLKSAHAIVTTSVAEGFGMAFLEPWLAHRGVTGRNLPDITTEFVDAGVDLGGMYSNLHVPMEWVGIGAFQREIQSALSDTYRAYGRWPTPDDVARCIASSTKGSAVDFGRLSERLQRPIIRRVAESSRARGECSPQSLWDPSKFPDVIKRNQALIADHYSLENYGARLHAIYRQVADSRAEAPLDSLSGKTILDRFLAPENLYLLRT